MSLRHRLVTGRFGRLVRDCLQPQAYVFGPPERLALGRDVVLNDALLNTTSGRIEVGDFTFCGHRVSLLTGSHDIAARGRERQRAIAWQGRDIVIGRGVWLASNATILGPCRIGDDAVVAAGAVVTGDVAAGAVVAGVPARVVRPPAGHPKALDASSGDGRR